MAGKKPPKRKPLTQIRAELSQAPAVVVEPPTLPLQGLGRRLATPIRSIPMPPRIARLPLNSQGYPISWFVAENEGSRDDLRYADGEKRVDALRFGLCWVCGQKLGRHLAFPIGPMCTINRITSEPPCHIDCARYSARACPFMSRPQFQRRASELPDGYVAPPGFHNDRNPGIAVVWSTLGFRQFATLVGGPGRLISLGNPIAVEWWRSGRPASRAAAQLALEDGLPLLRDECLKEDTPEAVEQALEVLERQYRAALQLLPGGTLQPAAVRS